MSIQDSINSMMGSVAKIASIPSGMKKAKQSQEIQSAQLANVQSQTEFNKARTAALRARQAMLDAQEEKRQKMNNNNGGILNGQASNV